MHAIIRAPEIAQPGLTWFNVPAALSLEQLRGRLVILDFWTSCCINCMHVIPTLRRVEEAFPTEVAVIGVHSPKFPAERDPDTAAKAVARYGITHPVIHDPDKRLWGAYAIRAWPTLVFVSPRGYVLGEVPGEPNAEKLLALVEKLVRQAQSEDALAPAALDLTAPELPAGTLRFPGKIKRIPGSEPRWAVADTGHHQVAVFDAAGRVVARYGNGEPGFIDGGALGCSFNSPQGLIAERRALYVADTGNHAIRRIGLYSNRVTTLAGTGRRGMILGAEDAPAAATDLASPWDLEVAGRRVYFANAGTHQLGMLDLERGQLRALAGTGQEGLLDGPALSAHLAQPSGLALSPDGKTLYFADSETSAIRALSLDRSSMVRTLAGKGLFTFGHANGPLDEALFQHPLGIAWMDGKLLIADSYNGVLRLIDLASGSVGDLGTDFLCADPVCLPPGEPAGAVAEGEDRVLVADTNNHRILDYRLSDRQYRTWSR